MQRRAVNSSVWLNFVKAFGKNGRGCWSLPNSVKSSIRWRVFWKVSSASPGLTLHGSTSIRQRKEAVDRFQDSEYVPFLVLSLKAGGVGLNLTGASHVIHFDRWWNPAVENQATDRAYRIGQMKNVMVHKFICKGTIEEKIDALIEDKKKLAGSLVPSAAENWITELDDSQLRDMFRLTIVSSENGPD